MLALIIAVTISLILGIFVLICLLIIFISQGNLQKDIADLRIESREERSKEIFNREVSDILNMLQDLVETGEEVEGYPQIEVNLGKLQILQGRLKALTRRLDENGKGYLLSCLVQSGLSNNPFILEELDFCGAQCPEEFFFGADLSRIVARDINWTGAILSEARLEGAKLSLANLSEAKLDFAKISSAYLNDIILENAYLKGADLKGSYLIESNLRRAYLAECLLDGAIMRKANLEGSNLSNGRLFAANLSEANLKGAVVRDALMSQATLSEADLTNSYLSGADFDSADLWRANFRGAIMVGTNFEGTFLREAKFSGIYKDLSASKEEELERLQEKDGIGLFSSSNNEHYGSKRTDFSRCQWWQAEFDKEAMRTLWKYLEENFAAPNGMELSDEEMQEYEQAKIKAKELNERN